MPVLKHSGLVMAVLCAIACSANAFVITPALRFQPNAAAPCSALRFRAMPTMMPRMTAAITASSAAKPVPSVFNKLKSVLMVFVVGFAMMLGAPAEADAASKGRSGGRAGGSSFRKPSQEYNRGVGRTTPAATTPSSVASPSTATTATAGVAGVAGGATVVHHVHHSPSPWFGGFGWHSPFHFGSPFGYGFGFRPMIILPSMFLFISISIMIFWLFFSR